MNIDDLDYANWNNREDEGEERMNPAEAEGIALEMINKMNPGQWEAFQVLYDSADCDSEQRCYFLDVCFISQTFNS